MNIYYLGLKKDTIKNNNFFKQAIVVKGGHEDITYNKIIGEQIDYNNLENFSKISKFHSLCIDEIFKKDKNAKFMLYNQAEIEYLANTKAILCLNDIALIKKLNNKPVCREMLSDVATILDYKYLSIDNISYDYVSSLFENKYKRYVVQQPFGFGGVGTFLFDKYNHKILKDKLNKEISYSVSGFIENALSVNNTFMVSNENIIIFDGSVQVINTAEELLYDGWNFEAYANLDTTIKSKIYSQTFGIAKKLQSLGYRGIAGIDYLIDKEGNVYFMEINPRFQASSEELDKSLIEKGFPSIFELNYLAFYNENEFKKYSKLLEKKV